MNLETDAIDFDPCRISQITTAAGKIAFIFPAQPCYSRAVGENPSIVPLYMCEISLSSAKIDHSSDDLSGEFDEFEVKYLGGRRSCFLPVGFVEAGPASIYFGQNGVKKITATGADIQLIVYEQVGENELWSSA